MVQAPQLAATAEAASTPHRAANSQQAAIRAALTVLAPALAAVLVRQATGPRTVDDAYITFRYARHLAEGAGLVYNPGEWVLGTTTPLWAMLLAACYALGGTDLPAAAATLASLADAGTAALLSLLAARIGLAPLGAALVGAAWAFNPLSVAYAAGGMETSLFVLVVVGGLALATAGRVTWAAMLAGVGTLVRPEAALLVAVILGYDWHQRRRLDVRPWVAAAAPALTWAAASTLLYGSPVPQTVLAKQAAYQSGNAWQNLLAFLLQAGLPGWSTFIGAALQPAATLVLAAIGAATMAVLLRQAPRAFTDGQARVWLPFACFGAAYLLFHVVGGLRGARLFPWYLVPLAPLYLLGAAAGGWAITRARWRRAPWLVGAAALLWQLPAIDWAAPFQPSGFDLRREALYQQVGLDLERELPPGAVVAAPEIGALGYYAGSLRILDTVGLVTPSASRYYPLTPEQLVADNAVPPRLVADARPDAVVTLDQFARRSLLPDPEFQRHYRLERSVPAPIWLSQELLVFRRREAL